MKLIRKYLQFSLYLGIALIVLAMVLGHFHNWRGKAVLLTTDKTNVFITSKNEIKIVPYALTLERFNRTYYDSGEPKKFEAIIDVEENNELKSISLYVNHPCKMGFGEDLYLIGYDRENPEDSKFCIVELVYDPFQGVVLVGIILMILGLILSVLEHR